MVDAHTQFHEAMRSVGLQPPEAIEPGQIHRFPGVGKRSGNRAGWCILFKDCQGGCFGDWSAGFSMTWKGRDNQPYAQRKLAESMDPVESARTRMKQRQAMHAKAAYRATQIWGRSCAASPDHPYLKRKGIKPHEARTHRGLLLLPVKNLNGELVSLQFIEPDGSKRLLKGGRKQGCFIPVNRCLAGDQQMIICEGWATGCSLAEEYPELQILAAGDANNLKALAVMARFCFPEIELIIAGDDDRKTPGNPGAGAAKAAAEQAHAALAFPSWPHDAPDTLSDFNDLANWMAQRGDV